MKELDQVDLREKVDFYCSDHFGRIDGRLKDQEFGAVVAIAHQNMPVIAAITQNGDLLLFDV